MAQNLTGVWLVKTWANVKTLRGFQPGACIVSLRPKSTTHTRKSPRTLRRHSPSMGRQMLSNGYGTRAS
ncbi:hypothetical protein EC845_2573 [Comamonas sp. BIGb0124]|nr:hypothetical protein EC845_2573 [Comamonas sp. BIGb0124]